MTLWFLRGLRRGVVTTHYPHRPERSAAAPTPPSFRPEALSPPVADLLCWVCPSHALRRDGDEILFDVGACTACGRCQEVAPGAARASGEFELATTNRAALIKRIPLLGGDS